ncbi:hypothetical protein HF563_02065 [Acidithiobacillus ferridurans]|nr:hypothetical protein [Acidithiobacillus ferridurans]
MNKLEELTAAGMNPRYVTQKLIVDNYHDIMVARGYRRTWQEIAEALEVPHGKVALASAWARTRKAVTSGKLKIPPKKAATKPASAAPERGSTWGGRQSSDGEGQEKGSRLETI